MADNTNIEWTDATWNIVTGCSVVSPGCTNCYAMRLAGTRLRHHPSRAGLTVASRAGPVWNGRVRFNTQWLRLPIEWKRPRRIFVCAHGDLFHEAVPSEWLDQVFTVMAMAPQHTFQVLTKRTARMRAYLSAFTFDGHYVRRPGWKAPDRRDDNRFLLVRENGWPLPNVWLGTSVEDQQRADERIPDLLATPAAVRFISAEPLLSAVDLSAYLPDNPVHEMQAKRGIRLPSSAGRGSGNPSERGDMARSETRLGPVEADGGDSPLQAGESGARSGRLFPGADHGRQDQDIRAGAPTGVPPLQGADPGRSDDQSRRREEEEQRAEQPAAGDELRATNSRGAGAESRTRLRPERREEQHGGPDNGADGGDQAPAREWGEVDYDRKRFRDSVRDGFEDRPRRATLDLVIAGGESGPNKRPVNADWLRGLRDQCATAGVAFFAKQIDKVTPLPPDLQRREFPAGAR